MIIIVCRIDINFVIKVADFGLSESVGPKEYFRQDKDSCIKLPLKWLAPESMEDGVFSEKSDVVIWHYLKVVFASNSISYMQQLKKLTQSIFSCGLVGFWCDLLGDF